MEKEEDEEVMREQVEEELQRGVGGYYEGARRGEGGRREWE